MQAAYGKENDSDLKAVWKGWLSNYAERFGTYVVLTHAWPVRRSVAERNAKRFGKLLSERIFGKYFYRRKQGLASVFTIEIKAKPVHVKENQRFNYHINYLIESHPLVTKRIVSQIWAKVAGHKSSDIDLHVEPTRSKNGVISYILKDISEENYPVPYIPEGTVDEPKSNKPLPTARRNRRRSIKRLALRATDLDLQNKGAKLTGNVRLYQRSNGRWYARFTLNGKRRMLSTGETDETRALLKLGEIVKNLCDNGTKALKSFSELAREYNNYAEINKAPSTLEREKYTMRILIRTFGKMKLTTITRLDIDRHIQQRRKEVAPASINRELSLLKNMLKMAVQWEYLDKSPARDVKAIREPPGRVKWLSEAERERLLDACKRSANAMLYEIVLVALLTGMRKGEMQRLTWDDVDFEKRLITVRHSKNNETRYIPINKILLPVLVELNKKNIHAHYVFSKPDGTAYGNWRGAFESACKLAGFKDFRFHDLRHCFGSSLGMAQYNLYTIKALMGHKTLSMSDRYTHISEDVLRAAVDDIGAKMVQSETNSLDNLLSDEFTTGR